MMKYGNLVIRADANTKIGVGHVMRSMALAQAWQDYGGRAVLALSMDTPILEDRFRSEGMDVVNLTAQPGSNDDAIETAILAQNTEAAWVAVDGYHFDSEYQRLIKESGLNLLLIDDIGHAKHYWADIVLNQNIHANEGLYASREPYTSLLLGTSYVLLRREFLHFREWTREIPDVARKVLVTLGGGDSDNVTLKVIQALNQIDSSELEVKIVVGPSNPHMDSLRAAVHRSPFNVHVLSSVRNMPGLMAWADMAVSAGGSTCWELAFMGLPNLILIFADNQILLAEGLHTEGVALNLGWSQGISDSEVGQAIEELMTTLEVRQKMARCGRELVDGEGAGRVLKLMRNKTLRFRRACEEDCLLLWEWINEADARSASFTSETIPLEKHVQWLKRKLNDPRCIFYIVYNGKGMPVGQVRYDLDGKEAVISISIERRFRGQGYGNLAISLSSWKLFHGSDVGMIRAYIKQNNKGSVGAFLKAGFRDAGTKIIEGYRAIELVLTRYGMV